MLLVLEKYELQVWNKHLDFGIHQTVQQELRGPKSEARELGFWTSIHQHHSEEHCNLVWESSEQFLTSPLSPFGSTLCQSGSHQNWCYLELLDLWKREFPTRTESGKLNSDNMITLRWWRNQNKELMNTH